MPIVILGILVVGFLIYIGVIAYKQYSKAKLVQEKHERIQEAKDDLEDLHLEEQVLDVREEIKKVGKKVESRKAKLHS